MTENVLNFKIDFIAGTEGARRYIDIARNMSLVNRRLERQQGLWHVLGVRCFAHNLVGGLSPYVATPFQVSIRGAPRTWVVRNALVKAFSKWKDQQAEAYQAVGTNAVKPTWQDFKVYLSEDHVDGTELVVRDGDQFTADSALYSTTGAEWVHSKFVYDIVSGGGTGVAQYEPFMHILGDDDGTDSVGAVLQYQESRRQVPPTEPILPAGIDDNIYVKMDEGLADEDIAVIDNMSTDNNNPPYDPDDYPGSDTNAQYPQCYAIGASVFPTVSPNSPTNPLAGVHQFVNLNGFAAPNGLIEIDVDLDKGETDVGAFWIQLIVGKREAY